MSYFKLGVIFLFITICTLTHTPTAEGHSLRTCYRRCYTVRRYWYGFVRYSLRCYCIYTSYYHRHCYRYYSGYYYRYRCYYHSRKRRDLTSSTCSCDSIKLATFDASLMNKLNGTGVTVSVTERQGGPGDMKSTYDTIELSSDVNNVSLTMNMTTQCDCTEMLKEGTFTIVGT